MSSIVLFESPEHSNILLDDHSSGGMVQANQHLVIHKRSGMILDPGGHKVYSKVLAETSGLLGGRKLEKIFLSHQDPDIVAAVNGWLMTTDADAWASKLWIRFIPHFGLDSLVADRLKPIPDEGMVFDLEGAKLLALPAHFLHSCGNFQLYDTVSKILYSGDLGASVDTGYREVSDFDAHIPMMDAFHRRYMGSNRAMRAWAEMVKQLDIQIIAPQHGALFRGPEMVKRFIFWCEELECGIDLLADKYRIPEIG